MCFVTPFVRPIVRPTVWPTCKIALFPPPFFIAIQQQTGIFLACQPRQNARRLNAIKQPFEHRLTAIYTPLSLPIIFVASGKCPCASIPAVLPPILPTIYPLFRVFCPSLHVLLTSTPPFYPFLAHVIAFHSFPFNFPTTCHFTSCTPLFYLFLSLRFSQGYKKSDRRSAV